jgi:hypothetical protein
MAPEPRDLFWPNLAAYTANSFTKLLRGVFVMILTFLLISFSTFVVTSIAALIDLEQLAIIFPALGIILKDIPEAGVQFIQGVIPTILLSCWLAVLPSVLLMLCQMQGLEAVSWIENSLLSKYFFYILWNVLFVTVFARTLIYDVLQNPSKVISLLGSMLPKSSVSMINYISLQAFVIFPFELLLLSSLCFTWIRRIFKQHTPRETSTAYYPTVLTDFNYGAIYPIPILVFVIGLTFAAIAPLILIFCCIFFAIGYFVYKYIILFVHLPKYEARGIAATYVYNRCIFGVMLMQITMMGVLSIRVTDSVESGEWSKYAQMIIGILPLVLITIFMIRMTKKGHLSKILNTPLDLLNEVSGSASRGRSDFELHEARQPSGSRFPANSGIDVLHLDVSIPSDDEFALEGENSENSFLLEHEEGSAFLAAHREPPMTRTPGVLDIPFGAAFAGVSYEEQSHILNTRTSDIFDDLLAHSYIHPALIGKLPLPWLPGMLSSSKLDSLVQMQSESQRRLYTRLLAKLKILPSDQINTLDSPKLKGYFEAISGWLHLSLA